MKWGFSCEEAPSERMLYWVLTCVLCPYPEHLPLDRLLKKILGGNRALGGDPGWCIEYEEDEKENGYYRVYANPDIAGYEPSEVCYMVETFQKATKETLLALAIAFPERATEAHEVIKRYNL